MAVAAWLIYSGYLIHLGHPWLAILPALMAASATETEIYVTKRPDKGGAHDDGSG